MSDTRQYAGFWVRLLATLIDTALLSLIISPLMYAVYGGDYFSFDSALSPFLPTRILIEWILPFIGSVVLIVYKSATPGKMVLKLRIVDDETGGKLSFKQSTIRYLGYIPSSVFFFLGFIWVAFDPKKQAWQDKIASTVVIKYSK